MKNLQKSMEYNDFFVRTSPKKILTADMLTAVAILPKVSGSEGKLQLTGIREVGRSVHIYEVNKNYLNKIDIGRCLTPVRQA